MWNIKWVSDASNAMMLHFTRIAVVCTSTYVLFWIWKLINQVLNQQSLPSQSLGNQIFDFMLELKVQHLTGQFACFFPYVCKKSSDWRQCDPYFTKFGILCFNFAQIYTFRICVACCVIKQNAFDFTPKIVFCWLA